MHHAPKGISSKNDRAKVHSDGPSLVLSWSISQLVNYHVRCVSFSFRLFIWYLRYGIVGTFRYGGDKICGADGAAAREPGTIIYGTHAAFSYALNRGAMMHCAAG